MNIKTRGTVCGILGGIFWGFSGCCGQYLFDHKDMDSTWLTTIRLLCSGLLLLLLSLITQRSKLKAALHNKRDFGRIMAFGIFGLMLTQLSYLTSIKYTNAATATVIQYAGPVMVMVVVCVMAKRMPKLNEFTALLFAVAGTFIVATHGDPTTLVISQKGLIWCIIAALTVVTYTLLPGHTVARYSSAVVNGYGMTAGGILLLLITRPWTIPVNIDFGTVGGLAGIIIVGTVLAFSLYLQAISDIGPVKASIIASIEPVASAVISAVWLGNRFAAMDLIGFALIISTVFLLNDRRKNAAN